MPLPIAHGRIAGHAACFAACDKADLGEPAAGAAASGRIACLHAIGVDELLRALDAGVRHWLVARGDCDTCPRGAAARLAETLARLNDALAARRDPGIRLKEVAPRRWLRAQAASAAVEASRRKLFGARALAECVAPLARDLARFHFAGPGPLPHAIHLDLERCVACHACARVCPDGAIRLEEGLPAYILEHRACGGCGLCVDVCDREAIRLRRWESGADSVLRLKAGECRACGTAFHAFAEPAHGLCPPCAERPGRRRADRIKE